MGRGFKETAYRQYIGNKKYEDAFDQIDWSGVTKQTSTNGEEHNVRSEEDGERHDINRHSQSSDQEATEPDR